MTERKLFKRLAKNEFSSRPDAKWGLVLAGGGTKGAYEVGVWKAIQELGIPLQGIAGTSIGALNAAMFLCMEQEQIENVYRNINITDVLPVSDDIDPRKNIFDPANFFAIAKEYVVQRGLTNDPLRNMLVKNLDVDKIYDSPLDLGIVTYNVKTREPHQLFKEDIEKDKLIDYLLASANFPIYKAQTVDGKQFMDGGLYDNMPFNMLIERGYTHLIVVDINGVGMTRKLKNSEDVYIQMITCSEDLGGTFEFNKDRIERNMRIGYLDALKDFHALFGNQYFFHRNAFNDLLKRFDMNTIWGLETAAEFYNMDRTMIYTADEFLDELEERHDEMERKYQQKNMSGLRGAGLNDLKKAAVAGVGIPALVQAFTENPVSRSGNLGKAMPEMTDAANAIIELKNYRKL